MNRSICSGVVAVMILASASAWAADAPATQPVKGIVPEAQALLDQVAAAYRDAKSLKISGTFTADFDAAGRKERKDAKFTTAYSSPVSFNHDVDGQVQTISTADKLYIYEKRGNAFLGMEAIKEKIAGEPPAVLGRILEMHLALRLAIAKDPAQLLGHELASANVGSPTGIDGTDFPTIQGADSGGNQQITLVVDPKSHLLRRVTYDLRGMFEAKGVPDAKVAAVTVDYATTSTDAADAAQFAWTPPAGARDLGAQKGGGGGEEAEATALEGKAAPDIKLAGMDEKAVALSDLKGSVVVLDFWATWCGPCRASLPHLDQVYKDLKEQGLKVYAVNLKEEKDVVKAFIEKTGLSVPVLLDSDGRAAEAYMANAIPETVIIGRDGKVAKVMVGAGPEEELRAAIKAALEAK